MKISEQIKKYREERKLSYEALANLLNVSYKTVIRWELGDINPSIDQLNKICEVLNIEHDEIIPKKGSFSRFLIKFRCFVSSKVLSFIFIGFTVLCLLLIYAPIFKTNYSWSEAGTYNYSIADAILPSQNWVLIIIYISCISLFAISMINFLPKRISNYICLTFFIISLITIIILIFIALNSNGTNILPL